jgi:hypothetical protein
MQARTNSSAGDSGFGFRLLLATAKCYALPVSVRNEAWVCRRIGPPCVRRKVITFTEHRDTLDDLTARLRNHLGRDDAVVTIHGKTRREDRYGACSSGPSVALESQSRQTPEPFDGTGCFSMTLTPRCEAIEPLLRRLASCRPTPFLIDITGY